MKRQLTLAAALLAGASLAACQQQAGKVAAMPLTMADGAPLADAPPASALPAAQPPPLAPLSDPYQGYAYADRAWAMSTAFGDSPPDYAFDDDGVTPWVWEADDNSWLVAEPCDGGERYYYYQAGSDEPYFIEDPDYGYGFSNGALVVVYDHDGRELPARDFAGQAEVAGRYLARGETLRRAAQSDPHQAVAANNWDARRGVIAAQRTAWTREATSDPAWRAYHNQNQGQELAHWSGEAARRETLAAQSDTRLGDTARAAREQQQAQADAQARPAAVPFGGRPALAALPSHGPAVTQPAPRYADLGGRPGQQPLLGGRTPAAQAAPAPQRAVVARNEPRAGMFAPQQAPAAERRAFAAPQSRPAFTPERAAAPAPAPRAAPQMFNERRAPAAAPMRAAPVQHFNAPPAAFHAQSAPAFHAPAPRMSAPAFHAAPAVHVAAPAPRVAAPQRAAPAPHAAPAPGQPEKR